MYIFEYLDYRQLLCDLSKNFKKSRPAFTLQKLALRTQLHPPYLSAVLKKRQHLNADQLYSILKQLTLKEDEMSYALLLLDWERSSLPERKEKLLGDIQKIQKSKLQSESHLKAEKIEFSSEQITRFYINPDLQLVHMFLGVPSFSKDTNKIGESLNIDTERVQSCIAELKELGFVHESPKGLEKTKKRIHLPQNSPLCAPQQILLHYRSLQHQQLLNENEKYNFAVSFTGDPHTKEKIQKEFLKFLSVVENLVDEAPSRAVYQMNFDLFSWSRSRS